MKNNLLPYLVLSLLICSITLSSCKNGSEDNPVIIEEEKHPTEISWQAIKNLPSPRYLGDAVVCGEKIYHIGGRSETRLEMPTLEYDPTQDLWNLKASIPTGTMNLALASIGDKIYAIGGDRFYDKNEIYNTVTNSWSQGAPMPTPRQHIDCGVVDGKIYVIGGLTSWENFSGINEVYDPATNTWESKAPMPTPRHNSAIVEYKNKIYVFGGAGTSTSIWGDLNTVEVYDPATDTWETKKNLPTIRFKPGAVVIDDAIYIIGGFAGGVMSARVDVYYPETDTWADSTQSMDLPKPILFSGIVALNNSIYVSGGSDTNWTSYSSNYKGTLK